MNINWRTFGRMALSIVMVASLTLILVHWHATSRGSDCGVCSVHQMPTIQALSVSLLTSPAASEWADAADQFHVPSSGITLLPSDRAPPAVSSSN